mgnify:CR=1 FL=1
MAVIKSLEVIGGHLWNGDRQTPTTNIGDLIEVIKSRRNREGDLFQVDYIGQEGSLDIEPSKMKCSNCRNNLEILR